MKPTIAIFLALTLLPFLPLIFLFFFISEYKHQLSKPNPHRIGAVRNETV